MHVLYIDTNHISQLARHPESPDSRAVRALLLSTGYSLGVSMLHIQELSAPSFKSRSAVGSLLDQIPIAWAPSPDELLDREVDWAIEEAISGEPRPRTVFARSFEEALGAPPEANIPISEMLEAMSERPHLRSHLQEVASYGARMDGEWKRNAAVVRAPEEPLLSHIGDRIAEISASANARLIDITPNDVLRSAGGLSGFPANNVAHRLARTRLNDDSFPTGENDIIDEWHACYAPYCAGMALDRRTAARFQMAQLPDASRVFGNLAGLVSALRII